MLWEKSWLDTRWRFLIGLILLVCSAGGVVVMWPKVQELMPLASGIKMDGYIGRQIREATVMQREYPGYIWAQWFRQNLPQMGTLVAVLLGSGSLLAPRSGALYLLSLPVSRNRLFGVRTATGLAELLGLVLVSSLLIPALSPTVGKSYGIGDALVHAICMFVAATLFFSLACLLSTVFTDLGRPIMLTAAAAIILALGEQLVSDMLPFGIYRVMSAESYFRQGAVPWLGLAACVAVSAALLYGAAINVERRDY
jgi:hypothetical protein